VKHQVQLPNDQLIDYWSFCKAIAEGICPADEKDWKGIDCIVGKQITVRAASAVPSYQENKQSLPENLQSLVNECSVADQEQLDRRNAIELTISYPVSGAMFDQQVGDFSLPYKLKDEDRRLMGKLLRALPTLHYPLSEKDVAEFKEAYSALPNRPTWEPLLITTAHVEKLKEEQYKVVCRHQKALLEELALGRLVAVTADHVRVTTFIPGVFIPKKEAIAYLDRWGISYVDSEFDEALPVDIKISEAKTRVVGEPRFTAQEKKDIVEFRQNLKDKKNKRYSALTAEKYKTSTSTVRKFVREAKREAEAAKKALSSRVVKQH
jgi:hypothetical protein